MYSFALHNKILQQLFTVFLALLIVVTPITGTIAVAHAAGTNVQPAGERSEKGATQADINLSTKIGQTIGYMVLSLASYVTGLGGAMLELAINELVLKMGEHFRSASLGNTINTMWSLVRDMCNLAFIFGFVYVGIRMIIDSDDNSTKRTLSQIIIGALLINFSLFFAKVIIDFSNILALEIYTKMVSGNGSISALLAQSLGLVGFFTNINSDTLANLTTGGSFAFYLMGALFLVVAGFVLAAGAILLVVRFVALIFILIFSPVLFAATVFPKTQQYSSKLMGYLINYSIFAPTYLFLLLISVQLLQNGISVMLVKEPLSAGLSSGKVESMGVILNFIIALFFIVLSLKVSASLGVIGATNVLSLGKSAKLKAQQYLGNMTFGLSARVMRNSVGYEAERMANDQNLKDRAATSKLSMMKLRMAENMANRSFDARQIGGVGAKTGIGIGKTGGYRQSQKEVNEQIEKRNKLLGTVDDTDVRVMARKKEMESAQREQRVLDEKLRQARQRGNESDIIRARDAFENSKKTAEEAKLKFEQEKLRRTTGSTFATVDEKATENIRKKERELEIAKNGPNGNDGLNEAWKNYLDTERTAEEKRNALDLIKKKNAEVIKLEKELNVLRANSTSDRGYAGVEERAKELPSWMTLQLADKRRKGGSELRAKAEKGLPKVKEDA